MRIRRFAVPPQALVVYVTCLLCGFAIGGISASWANATLIAFLRHDGLSTLRQFPRDHIVLATSAPWFDAEDQSIWNWGAIPVLVGCITLAAYGLRLARFIVVTKYGWMTDEEVEAMMKKDPSW